MVARRDSVFRYQLLPVLDVHNIQDDFSTLFQSLCYSSPEHSETPRQGEMKWKSSILVNELGSDTQTCL